jgi:hypothetical protein
MYVYTGKWPFYFQTSAQTKKKKKNQASVMTHDLYIGTSLVF